MVAVPQSEHKRRTAVKRHVLFIHGGGERVREADKKLAASLRDALGAAYDVRYPEMPDADRPEYEIWKDQIAEELSTLDGDVTLVGHSLGGSILLKYLSKEEVEKPVTGMFLLASPCWGAEDWEVGEYELQKDFASKLPEGLLVFLYHSRDDEVVPFAHLALYEAKLSQATVRKFDGRGHQFGDDLSEVAKDIREVVSTVNDQTEERRRAMNDRAGELNRLVEDWANAELAGDTDFLRATLADDFVGVGPLGFMLTKEQWVGRFAGGLSYESFALNEVDVRTYVEAVVVTCRQKQAGGFQGNDVGGEFRATLVLVKQEGRWLLAGWHASPIAGAPSFLNR